MATDEQAQFPSLLSALAASDWASVLRSFPQAEAWLRATVPGDPRIDELVLRIVSLAKHPKWEVRRAVANVASQCSHPAFERVLATLATDDNTRVRQAAESAALRRRDSHNASVLGKQHEDHINATLDDIEGRFGRRGRDAVKRASEQIANIFAREFYHEVIKLLSPLASSVDRLQSRLTDDGTKRQELVGEAVRIGHQVTRLRTVLDAMRIYTVQPKLTFTSESLKDILEEAAALAGDNHARTRPGPRIEVLVGADVQGEVSRSRLVQAFMNILLNAVESYEGLDALNPVVVRAHTEEGRVVISVEDRGCGMNEENLADASVLFATSKKGGTGFGLPLAIKIVESEHRGRLNIESGKGRGTTVQVIIPTKCQRDLP